MTRSGFNLNPKRNKLGNSLRKPKSELRKVTILGFKERMFSGSMGY